MSSRGLLQQALHAEQDENGRVRLSGSSLLVTRAVPLDDIRIRKDGTGRTVDAYALVFNSPSEIQDQDGHYSEQNHPGAVNKSLAERRDKIFCLYNHGKTLGGSPSDMWSVPIGKPIDMRADSRGLFTSTVYNKDPEADRILEAIRSGSLRGMSYTGVFVRSTPELKGAFARYAPDKDGNLPLVTRMEIALIEFGPTPIPAFSDAEVMGVRMKQIESWLSKAEEVMSGGELPAELMEQWRAKMAELEALAERIYAAEHPGRAGMPVHHTDVTTSPYDAQRELTNLPESTSWDTMQSLYALADEAAGDDVAGGYPSDAGVLPHHHVDGDGKPGPANLEAVKASIDKLPSIKGYSTDEKEKALAHLNAHLEDHHGSSGQDMPVGSSGERSPDEDEAERVDGVDEDEAERAKKKNTEPDGDDSMTVEARGGDTPGDGSKPYGDVTYADPGYQSDKKKRYPVDSADHVKAAWSYINHPKNAGKYSSSQLASIKAKIKSAAKKHGVEISDGGSGSKSGHFDWDAVEIWRWAETAEDPAGEFAGTCAGRRTGDRSKRSSWALAHHHLDGVVDQDAVKEALRQLPNLQGLMNRAAAEAHLRAHLANPAERHGTI